jgi:hypothetical protein
MNLLTLKYAPTQKRDAAKMLMAKLQVLETGQDKIMRNSTEINTEGEAVGGQRRENLKSYLASYSITQTHNKSVA